MRQSSAVSVGKPSNTLKRIIKLPHINYLRFKMDGDGTRDPPRCRYICHLFVKSRSC